MHASQVILIDCLFAKCARSLLSFVIWDTILTLWRSLVSIAKRTTFGCSQRRNTYVCVRLECLSNSVPKTVLLKLLDRCCAFFSLLFMHVIGHKKIPRHKKRGFVNYTDTKKPSFCSDESFVQLACSWWRKIVGLVLTLILLWWLRSHSPRGASHAASPACYFLPSFCELVCFVETNQFSLSIWAFKIQLKMIF